MPRIGKSEETESGLVGRWGNEEWGMTGNVNWVSFSGVTKNAKIK